MKEIERIVEDKLYELNIENIEDNSDEYMDSRRIFFKNGYALSIIRGEYSYGGKRGLFEIAPINKEGDLEGALLGIEGDDVLGYLTISEVRDYIIRMGGLK